MLVRSIILAAVTPATIAAAAGPAPTSAAAGSIPGADGSWDDASVDPATRRPFVPASGSGTLAVLAERSNKVRLVGTTQAGRSARTGTPDASDGTIYLPAARLLPAATGGRPKPAPGSFHLIVVAAR